MLILCRLDVSPMLLQVIYPTMTEMLKNTSSEATIDAVYHLKKYFEGKLKALWNRSRDFIVWCGSWSNFCFVQPLRRILRALHSTWSRWWSSSCKLTTTAVLNSPWILCLECPTPPLFRRGAQPRTIWPNSGRRSSILMARWALSRHRDHLARLLLSRAADLSNDTRWNFNTNVNKSNINFAFGYCLMTVRFALALVYNRAETRVTWRQIWGISEK